MVDGINAENRLDSPNMSRSKLDTSFMNKTALNAFLSVFVSSFAFTYGCHLEVRGPR